MGFISVREAAALWNMSVRSIQWSCKQGKIKGVKKVGDGWYIPADAPRPRDGRVITGKYVDWRKKYPKERKEQQKENKEREEIL